MESIRILLIVIATSLLSSIVYLKINEHIKYKKKIEDVSTQTIVPKGWYFKDTTIVHGPLNIQNGAGTGSCEFEHTRVLVKDEVIKCDKPLPAFIPNISFGYHALSNTIGVTEIGRVFK